MTYKYATQDLNEKMAKAVKVGAQASFKQSVEMASWLRGRSTTDALHLLSQVQVMNIAVPARRFNRHLGHKPGIGPGRYFLKTATLFAELINAVVKNAENQSLDTKNLVIHSIVVNRGAKSFKYSRIRGLKAKNTHIELVVTEKAAKKVIKKDTKPAPAATSSDDEPQVVKRAKKAEKVTQ
jgi:large subunit ribosomal protein L22